eukprot:Gregarina_sp_Poly_1__8241@NODE_47_length_17802_cov_82_087454_g41_i0_p1_GENE_NODE_47_length_17802_cov_82_087454_g41_i0NODE_47_length_17802_cov_82_087454_g41_i0_p1_ORF_typecomplete_len3389_score477_67Big_5/PF13205_6/7_2e08Big_5/PF13205_6/1_3e08Sushi/PF00084_20/2_8e02Sushi/PF00084_20/0_072Sushi/PF00084_20/6Sushi/PF00084_20/1_6e04Sushi/PF00084_20/4_4e02Sushi/PF00084_20/1_2e04Sushi/PF00084_20/1_2e03Sushi/PF00084_20/1_1e03Sushi/PF00084_20/5_1e03Sushi/PF00084_20/1_3e04Sushi/PF00084_20/0_34Sushi/PF00084
MRVAEFCFAIIVGQSAELSLHCSIGATGECPLGFSSDTFYPLLALLPAKQFVSCLQPRPDTIYLRHQKETSYQLTSSSEVTAGEYIACAPKRKDAVAKISVSSLKTNCTEGSRKCIVPVHASSSTLHPSSLHPFLVSPTDACSSVPTSSTRTLICQSSPRDRASDDELSASQPFVSQSIDPPFNSSTVFCVSDIYHIPPGFYKVCVCPKRISSSHIQTFWTDFCDLETAEFTGFLNVVSGVQDPIVQSQRRLQAVGNVTTGNLPISDNSESATSQSNSEPSSNLTSPLSGSSAMSNISTATPSAADSTAAIALSSIATGLNLIPPDSPPTPAVFGTSSFPERLDDIGSTELPVNLEDLEVPIYEFEHRSCETRADCNQFETCIDHQCAGFDPDLSDTNLIRCVDGYRCDVTPGEIIGHRITTDFQVIGVSPAERCGTAQPLPTKLSIFANSNRWRCEDVGADGVYCAFSPGVGVRRNKTISLEGLRLCGCPASDLDGNGVLCDNEADFYVPLAKLGVQECLANAHCLHKAFAYCVNDHCAGFMGVAASAGIKAYQCLLNKSCSIQSLAARALNEGLKVVPIATTFSCGAEQALDANFFNDAALPCIMDVNGDGLCDIHLGVARAIGTNRLCGCNGKDLGGNGRPCDELADFDTDLGTLTVQECVVDQDCRQGMCIDTVCVLDTQAPYAVAIHPGNGSIAVPPVTEIRITFNENIRFTKTGDRRFVLTTSSESVKFEIPIQDPTTTSQGSDAYRVSISGRDLIVLPDIRMTTLPEGFYLMGFEGGIVEDLQGNGNLGSTDFSFTISSSANCPFLGVTGFSVDNVNMNGVYRSAIPLNGRARWIAVNAGDAVLANTIFWRAPTAKLEGRWVIGFNYDDSKFLAYSDVAVGDSDPSRPPSGLWKRWKEHKWKEQPDIIITCPETRMTSSPKFVQTDPLPGARGVDPENFQLVFYFDRPVTFGHWSTLYLKEVGGESRIVVDPEDPEVRGRILLRDVDSFKMTFKPDVPLKAGTQYSLILETGVFTDLQYNPSPPIVDGDFLFTTFGAPCLAYPTAGHVRLLPQLSPSFVNESEAEFFEHGTDIEVACQEYYSPKFSAVELNRLADVITFGSTYPTLTPTHVKAHCHDGDWDFVGLRCKALCRQYQKLGSQYEVSVLHVATDDGLLPFNFNLQNALNYSYMKDGSQININCAETSEAVNGSPLGETSTCQDGRWSPIALRCGATCGVFPSLGPGYKLLSTDNSVKIGSHRIIACNDDVSQTGQERLNCLESGWELPTLACHYDCEKLQDRTVGHQAGLVQVSALTANSPAGNSYGDAYLYSCAPDTIPQLSNDATDADMSSYEEIFWNATTAVPLTDEQVIVACFEGSWKKSKPLTCQRSCTPFEAPGTGYESRRILGDGLVPGSTYELTCRNDAVAQYTSSRTTDTAVCLRGHWTRLTHNIICFGSCRHPALYFGENYVIRDSASGEIVDAPISKGLSFKHHSKQYRLECAAGNIQPLSAPLLSTPNLHEVYDVNTQSSLLLDPVKVVSIPTLFEKPSQVVSCDDGRWLPASHEITTTSMSMELSGAVRCSPFCASLPHPSHARYRRDEYETGIGWGAKRKLSCAKGFAAQAIVRESGELKLVARDHIQLDCLYGLWVAPMAVVQIPGLSVTPAPNGKGMIVLPRSHNVSSVDLRFNIANSLTCAIGCSKRSLEAMISKRKLRIIKPSKSRIPKFVDHAYLVEVGCDKSSERISGPSVDYVACSDSEWTQPLLVCAKPSCSDFVKNQGETGIDCGGPCHAECVQAPCETDGSCKACESMPTVFEPETVIYTLEGSKSSGKYLNLQTALPLAHGQIVHAHLNESFLLPVTKVPSVPYLPFECLNGEWSPLKVVEPLGAQAPVCNDGVMGRGEWGVDCGGFCAKDCPECVDGLVNGDEEWVDCGGSVCAPCGACHNNDLKYFIGDNYLLQVVQSPISLTPKVMSQTYNASLVTTVQSAHWKTASTAHGAQRRVSCSSAADAVSGSPPLDLICLNSRWWPLEAAVSAINAVHSGSPEALKSIPNFRLKCESKDKLQLQSAAFGRFKPLPAHLTLPFCHSSSNEEFDSTKEDAHYCCELISAWMEQLAGECGALIYGNNNVDAFCQGVCWSRIQQLTTFHNEKSRQILQDAAAHMSHQLFREFSQCQEVASYIEEISAYFCFENKEELSSRQNNASMSSPLRQVKSPYCFAQATQTLNQVKNFNVYTKTDDLHIICQSDSCFRNNLHYLAALWDMLSHTNFIRSSKSRRRLQSASLSPLELHFNRVETAFLEHQDFIERASRAAASVLSENLPRDLSELPLRRDSTLNRRRLLSHEIFSDPNDLKFNPSIINLMCLQDNRGDTCAPYLQQLSWGIEKLSQTGGEEIGMIAASLSTVCVDTCFLQISRHLGQQLALEATENSDPYKRFFGTLLKLYGRYYCQENNQGGSCAVKYFGRLLQGFSDTNTAPAAGQLPIRSLPSCDTSLCPLDYVNDGMCDPSCFIDVCAYDGKDCFVASMFPSVFRKLSSTLSLSDSCHPLNQEFKACKKHSTCYNRIKDVLLKDGCCFAVGLDIMKELLDLEFFSHPVLRGDKLADKFVSQIRSLVFPTEESKMFADSGNFTLGLFDSYKPDRSSIYPQVLCNLFVDRTCSRGLSRRVLDLQYVAASLPFDAVQWILPASLKLPVFSAEFPPSISFPDFQDVVAVSAPYLRFALFVRKKLADLFALPLADIRDLRVWPDPDSGGTLVQITIDSGQFSDEIIRAMQLTQSTGELEKALATAQQLWRSGLSSPVDDLVNYFSEIQESKKNRLLTAMEEIDIMADFGLTAEDLLILEQASKTLPAVKIENIWFGPRNLAAVRASASLTANYSGGDPLVPMAGTFDVGDIDIQKASCPDFVWIDQKRVPLSDYQLSGPLTYKHGQKIEVQCKTGLTPSVDTDDAFTQSVTCVNGRWIATDKRAFMTCHATCEEFTVPAGSLLQSSGIGTRHGSSRSVSCSAGFQATRGGPTQRTVCIDGEWTPVTLQCQKVVLFDASCGGAALEPLPAEFRFSISEVASTSSLRWWKASCQRGYERGTGLEPLQIVCLDDSRLFVFGETPVTIAIADGDAVLDASMRQWIADGTDIGQVAQVDLARLPWSTALPLRASSGRLPLNPHVTLSCTEAVIADPQLLEDTGIDDWTYIGLVAAMAIGVTSLFAAWGYYWQVRGRHRHEQRKLRKLEKKIAAKRRRPDEGVDSDGEFRDADGDRDHFELDDILAKPGTQFPSTQDTDLPGLVSDSVLGDDNQGDGAWHGGSRNEHLLFETASSQQPVSQGLTDRLVSPSETTTRLQPRAGVNYLAVELQQRRQHAETASSTNSYYSDLELFAHQRHAEAVTSLIPNSSPQATGMTQPTTDEWKQDM